MKATESTRKVGGRFALADYFAPILLVDDGSDCFKDMVSRTKQFKRCQSDLGLFVEGRCI